jgi:hypothetical protein
VGKVPFLHGGSSDAFVAPVTSWSTYFSCGGVGSSNAAPTVRRTPSRMASSTSTTCGGDHIGPCAAPAYRRGRSARTPAVAIESIGVHACTLYTTFR